MINRHGYSPFQHVFGCSLRFSSSILNEDACVVHNSAFLHGDHDVVRGQALRMAARQAMLAMDNDDKIRRAIEHCSRPERGPFEVGDMVYFYRRHVGGKGIWKGPGRVIGTLEGKSKMRALKCCPEQWRKLSGDQEAAFRMVPVEILKKAATDRNSGAQVFIDISGEGAVPDQDEPVEAEPAPKRVRFSPQKEDVEVEQGGEDYDSAQAGEDFSRKNSAQQTGSRRSSLDTISYGSLPREGFSLQESSFNVCYLQGPSLSADHLQHECHAIA